jgi:hypothetical protein
MTEIWHPVEPEPARSVRFAKQVSEQIHEQKGEFAHLYVLERLVNANDDSSRKLWVGVLSELDKFERKDDEIPKL